jgi:hypothetical protein
LPVFCHLLFVQKRVKYLLLGFFPCFDRILFFENPKVEIPFLSKSDVGSPFIPFCIANNTTYSGRRIAANDLSGFIIPIMVCSRYPIAHSLLCAPLMSEYLAHPQK